MYEQRYVIPSKRQRGSTLVELSIVLMVIGVLSLGVFYMRGYVEDFREDETVTTIVAIQKAAPLWSERNNNGLGYGGGGCPVTISMPSICTAGSATPPVVGVGKLPNGQWNCGRLQTAWKGAITIRPSPFPPPVDYPATKVEITACLPDKLKADDVAAKLLKTQGFDSAVSGGGNGCAFSVVAVSNQ